MKRNVRWLLVPVSACGGFFLALVVGATVDGLVRSWCPWGILNPGDSPWCPVPVWVDGLMYCTFSSLAAVLVVLFGSRTAPSQETWLPWTIYALGAGLALLIALASLASLHGPHEADALLGAAWVRDRTLRKLATSVLPALCSVAAGAVTARKLARGARRVRAAPAP